MRKRHIREKLEDKVKDKKNGEQDKRWWSGIGRERGETTKRMSNRRKNYKNYRYLISMTLLKNALNFKSYLIRRLIKASNMLLPQNFLV